MLDLSPDKILVLGLVALVVLGPNRLPQAARSLGRFLGQMRALTASMQTELRDVIQEHDPDDTIGSVITELRPGGIRRQVRQAVTDTLASPASPRPGAGGPEATSTSPAPPQRRDTSAPARSPEDPSFN